MKWKKKSKKIPQEEVHEFDIYDPSAESFVVDLPPKKEYKRLAEYIDKGKIDWGNIIGFGVVAFIVGAILFGIIMAIKSDDSYRAEWDEWCLAQPFTRIETDPNKLPPTEQSFNAACVQNGTVIGTRW